MTMSTAVSVTKKGALRIGMVGGGVVGGGTYELLKSSSEAIITKMCVRDATKARDFTVRSDETEIVTDVRSVLDDPDIDLVVEVMGGTGLAKTVVVDSLKKNKHVVTANKALLAEHLDELDQIVHSDGTTATLNYEAAVCGGIPIIHTLQTSYTGDVIQQLQGICNGTTNYMLCKMENGADYGEVLKEAQDLGYAEADPTADVEGHDVRAKICLLAKLAYGVTVDPDQVPCQGISSITSIDFEYAKLLGCTIKLIGTAKRLAQNTEYDGPICVFVAPTMVSLTDSLASIRSSGNAVAVTSQNMGTCLYCGPGAGRFPTANSIVADIYRVARQQAPPEPFPPVVSTTSTPLEIDPNFTSPFYIRIPFQDEIGIIQRIGALAALHQISIYSIQQNPIVDRMAADFVLITEEAEHAAVEKFCADLQEETFCRAPPLAMPLLKKL